MHYRVKQISKDQFIPQVKKHWFGKWIEIKEQSVFNYSTNTGKYLYIVDSYGKAMEILEKYKNNCKEIKNYPKYWKIKL